MKAVPRVFTMPGRAHLRCASIRYFEQYGACVPCPTATAGASIAASVGLPVVLLLVFGTMFHLRAVLPQGLMKVGCAASALARLLMAVLVYLACAL